LWGISGYYEILETLKHPRTKEYKELIMWLDRKFDPESINIGIINARLGLLKTYIKEYEEEE